MMKLKAIEIISPLRSRTGRHTYTKGWNGKYTKKGDRMISFFLC